MTDTKAWPWMLFKVAGGTILAQAAKIGQFLAEPIQMRSAAIVWAAPANEATAKLCGEFWAAREGKA